MSISHQDVEQLAARAVEIAFERLGIDTTNAVETRADFAHLRRWRKMVESGGQWVVNSALGLLVICSVALLTNSPTVVASYKPIDPGDRVDDWLYQPETMYVLMLLYFIAAGAGPISVDQLLKLWIG